MASTTFATGTIITKEWLNEVNGLLWTAFNGANSPSLARTAISAVGLTGNETVAGVKTFSSVPVLSGGAIQFPATAIPSADANALDDYEEGTWTPSISFGGASVGITYGATSANYTKIGNRVFVDGFIILTSKGSSTGAMLVNGFPFTVNGASFSPLAVRVDSLAVPISGFFSIFPNVGTTNANLQYIGTGDTGVTNFTDTNISNTFNVMFSGSYRV